jgi:hypothetical protein
VLSRQEVRQLYELVLDREPESEALYGDTRFNVPLRQALIDLFVSEEFVNKNRAWISLLVAERL